MGGWGGLSRVAFSRSSGSVRGGMFSNREGRLFGAPAGCIPLEVEVAPPPRKSRPFCGWRLVFGGWVLKPTDIGGREHATAIRRATRRTGKAPRSAIGPSPTLCAGSCDRSIIARPYSLGPDIGGLPDGRRNGRGAAAAHFPISACAPPVACPGWWGAGYLIRTTPDAIRPVARRPRRGHYEPWGDTWPGRTGSGISLVV